MSEIKETDHAEVDSLTGSVRPAYPLPCNSYYGGMIIFNPCHVHAAYGDTVANHFEPVVLADGHIVMGYVPPAFATAKQASPSADPRPAPPGQEYVDPFLFETGHFESREEYEELSRTAKIKPRARA